MQLTRRHSSLRHGCGLRQQSQQKNSLCLSGPRSRGLWANPPRARQRCLLQQANRAEVLQRQRLVRGTYSYRRLVCFDECKSTCCFTRCCPRSLERSCGGSLTLLRTSPHQRILSSVSVSATSRPRPATDSCILSERSGLLPCVQTCN